MSTCPFCLESVKEGAKKCPHCQSDLTVEGENSKNVMLIVDRGLIRFGKFAVAIFGLFAIVLYTALGYHIEDSLKDIEKKSKELAQLYSTTRDLGLSLREKALDEQKELTKSKEYFSEKTKDLEKLKGEIEVIRNDSKKALDDVQTILSNTQVAGAAFNRIREEILAEMKAKAAGIVSITTETEVVAPGGRPRLWKIGAKLRVWFLDGTDDAKQETMKVASEWSKEGNINFVAAASVDQSDIRISFNGEGNWSFIGTDAQSVPKNIATMVLGNLTRNRITKRSFILHEFGHALGFYHENQNPRAKIAWNISTIQAETGLPSEQIATSFTLPYKEEVSPCNRDFDPNSIMMVAIPSSYTFNGQAFKPPLDLSNSDKICIRKMYPRS